MALPTFSTHGPSRARVQAAQWARQREQEAQRRQQWEHHVQYLRVESVRSQKQAVWSSQDSYQQSMAAYHKERLKEEKRASLEQRRDRLRILLEEERKQLEAELQEALSNRRTPAGHMRTKELLSEREERRKKIAQELLKEHRRMSESGKHKSVLHKDQVVGQELEQVNERQQQEETRCLERTRQQREERRRAERRRRADQLQKQMEELKLREAEATRLKKVQEALLLQQWELEKMEEERRKLVERRRKCEIGHLLIRQYRAQLRRRAQHVQEELEADRNILAALLEREEGETGSTRRELVVADAAWMKRVIEEQLQLERDREAEFEFLHRADAQHAWEKREAEWEKERKARERLMHEVLLGRQKQLELQMQRNREAQEESLRRREELIQQLETERELRGSEVEEEENQRGRAEEMDAEMRDEEDAALQEDELNLEVNQGHHEVPSRAAWT
ncbi:trichoplein keratin filament-binding protein isoform 1-T1 [Synchiropus picturatus]